jgi:putative phosphoesterase
MVRRRTRSISVYRVGIISDTHGLIRLEALAALQQSDLIIHAGDIGDPAVLEALRPIAPVHAIRGNNDKGMWASALPTAEVVEIGTFSIYVIHNIAELDLDPVAAGFIAVISGHSHKPLIQQREVLFINPGSAGPRRFKLPVTVGRLTLRRGHWEARIVELLAPQNPSQGSDRAKLY